MISRYDISLPHHCFVSIVQGFYPVSWGDRGLQTEGSRGQKQTVQLPNQENQLSEQIHLKVYWISCMNLLQMYTSKYFITIILYISLHTAPEDPPMEFSTILASDNARLAGTPTGKPGLSFGPKFWRMAVGMTEKYEIYVLNDFLHQKLLFVLNVNLFGTNRRYSYSFHSIPL